jgi:NADH:ubiquinone oxidoreductase subunit F (NADH-binding)
MVLLSNVGLVELCSVRLEIVLILKQDSCTVCTECTIGSQIVFDASDGLVSDMGRVESHFSPFGDSVSVSARQVHRFH